LPFEFFGGTDRGDYLRYRGRIVNAWSMLITELSPSRKRRSATAARGA
jgi:hypothetical protein